MQPIELTIDVDRALVLFEFLSRFADSDKLTIEDQSEARVLWDLQADLETRLDVPFSPDYKTELELARKRVRDDVGT